MSNLSALANGLADAQTKKQSVEPRFSSPDELVTFYIGPDLKRFLVHKEVACLHCPVFKAAFNSEFIEGQTQTYTIDDTTFEAFQYMVQWFYSQKFQSLDITEGDQRIYLSRCCNPTCIVSKAALDEMMAHRSTMSDPNIIQKLQDRIIDMCYIWVLADRLRIPRLQNLVIDEIERIRSDCKVVCFRIIKLVYDTKQLAVPKGAALREYVMEVCGNFANVNAFKFLPECFPKEMLLEFMISGRLSHTRPSPFTDKAEFKRRFHVPEDC